VFKHCILWIQVEFWTLIWIVNLILYSVFLRHFIIFCTLWDDWIFSNVLLSCILLHVVWSIFCKTVHCSFRVLKSKSILGFCVCMFIVGKLEVGSWKLEVEVEVEFGWAGVLTSWFDAAKFYKLKSYYWGEPRDDIRSNSNERCYSDEIIRLTFRDFAFIVLHLGSIVIVYFVSE